MTMTEKVEIQEAGRLEQLLGILLRSGVLLSALVVAIGAVLFLAHHGTQQPHFSFFQGQPAELRSVGAIAVAASRLDTLAIIQFGLLLLIATPIARVVFSLVGFVVQRDWMYIGITAVVLALLLFGLFGGGSKL
jgi:uncharacterized membrane protein